MAVGMSICPAKLYDKINKVDKYAKYKLTQRQFAAILQKLIGYAWDWQQEKTAKNIFMV
jgi:hypothetical protein